MEIYSIHLSNLRNEEHYKFHLDVDRVISQYTPRALGIEEKLPAYKAAFEVENKALNVVRVSAFTDDISEADLLRVNIYSGIAGTIKSATNHFDDTISGAANRLMLLLDQYDYIPSKPYDQETAAIIKLVAELEGAYAGFVTDLNQRIANYKQILAQRKGRNAKEDEEPTGEN